MTSLTMPLPFEHVLARRKEIAAARTRIVPGEGVVVSHPDESGPYESDSLSAYRQMPLIAALPGRMS